MSTQTQIARILAHLCAGFRISNGQLMDEFRIANGTGRISDVRKLLRARGIEMQREWVDGHGSRWLEFWLREEDRRRVESGARPETDAKPDAAQGGARMNAPGLSPVTAGPGRPASALSETLFPVGPVPRMR